MTARAVLAVALVVVNVSCQSDSPARAPVDLFAADGALLLSDQPILVVGGDDALPLHRVTGAVFFEDGVAITNNGSYEVIVVDENGRVRARQGGIGDGPGEYRNLAGVARHGDGLVTWDAYHLRLSRLDRNAEYLGGTTERIEVPEYHNTDILGTFGNSVLLKFEPMGFRNGTPDPQWVRQDVEIVIADLTHGRVALRLKVPGREEWAARRGTTHGGRPVVFGRTLAAAVAHNAAFVGDTGSPDFGVYDPSGSRTDVSLGHLVSPVLATDEWESQAREAVRTSAESMSTPSLRQFAVSLLEGLPARDTLPAFSDAMGGHNGFLWLRQYPYPSQELVTWVALDESFQPRHKLRVPAELQVLDISADRVLVRTFGPLGEELVMVYGTRQ